MNHEALAMDRARSYFRDKAALPASAVVEQIASAFDSLQAFLADVPPEVAARRTVAGEWSIQEIADHLLETYRPGVDELRCLLAGQRPPGDPIPADLQSKAPLLRPWPWLLEELYRVHRSILEVIDSVAGEIPGDARAPIVMVVNVPGPDGSTVPLKWVEDIEWKAYTLVSWRLHAIDHLKQARKVLAASR